MSECEKESDCETLGNILQMLPDVSPEFLYYFLVLGELLREEDIDDRVFTTNSGWTAHADCDDSV